MRTPLPAGTPCAACGYTPTDEQLRRGCCAACYHRGLAALRGVRTREPARLPAWARQEAGA